MYLTIGWLVVSRRVYRETETSSLLPFTFCTCRRLFRVFIYVEVEQNVFEK
jgi:hypothetical protein